MVSTLSVFKFVSNAVLMHAHILPAAEVYFNTMVASYLAHATPTPELKELVSSIMSHISKMIPHFQFQRESYLAIIRQWVRSIKLFHYAHTYVLT